MAGNCKIFHLMPYKLKKAGVVTTGSEVLKGRIKDTFTPVIVENLQNMELNRAACNAWR